MSELLLCDPMLYWLEPKDVLRLKAVNTICKEKVSQHMTAQRFYSTNKTSILHWDARERLYNLYPNVEVLTLLCDGVHRPHEYLRNSVKSLHLIFPLSIAMYTYIDGILKYPHLENTVHLVEALDQVLDFVQSNPHCALEHLQISFDPTVTVSFEIPNGLFAGYGSYGPLYDDLQCHYKTKKYPAATYLCVLEESSKKIKESIQRVLTHQTWSSSKVPQELLEESIDQTIQQKMYGYLQDICSRKI